MSKESRRRKRAMRALQQEMLDTGELSTEDAQDIIHGNMLERMSQMNHGTEFHHIEGFTITDKRRNSDYTRNQIPGTWHGNGEYNHHGGSGYVKNGESETTFRCDSDDILKPCPIAKTPTIDIPKRLWQEFCDLTKLFKTEWLAYLEGHFDAEGNRYVIERCYFPPQVVTGAHVEVDDDYEPLLGTIGAIHSHVNMQAFWSHEDMAHSNWPVEIVINAREEYEALVRMKLECGKWAKAKAEVMLVYPRSTAAYSDALKKAIEKGNALEEERRRKSYSSGYSSGAAIIPGSTQADLVRAAGGHYVSTPQAEGDTPALVIDMESGQVKDQTVDKSAYIKSADRTEPDPNDPSVLFNCAHCGFWHTGMFSFCRRKQESSQPEPETGAVPDATGHSGEGV